MSSEPVDQVQIAKKTRSCSRGVLHTLKKAAANAGISGQTLIFPAASFGSKGGNQYWFGLRKPPCQFLFGVCPCLQLFGNISYSLYSNHNHAGKIFFTQFYKNDFNLTSSLQSCPIKMRAACFAQSFLKKEEYSRKGKATS